jgi:hypothetical protein
MPTVSPTPDWLLPLPISVQIVAFHVVPEFKVSTTSLEKGATTWLTGLSLHCG